VTRGQLPQRAGSLGLNGGGTATAVPPQQQIHIHKRCSKTVKNNPYFGLKQQGYHITPIIYFITPTPKGSIYHMLQDPSRLKC